MVSKTSISTNSQFFLLLKLVMTLTSVWSGSSVITTRIIFCLVLLMSITNAARICWYLKNVFSISQIFWQTCSHKRWFLSTLMLTFCISLNAWLYLAQYHNFKLFFSVNTISIFSLIQCCPWIRYSGLFLAIWCILLGGVLSYAEVCKLWKVKLTN